MRPRTTALSPDGERKGQAALGGLAGPEHVGDFVVRGDREGLRDVTIERTRTACVGPSGVQAWPAIEAVCVQSKEPLHGINPVACPEVAV